MPRMPAAAAAVILANAGSQLGVLYLDAPEDVDALSARDADFLLSCAGQFGALFATHRQAESGRLVHADEFELTRRVQRRFLPLATPRFDGYEIADSYSAARIVGGDLFDFLTLVDGAGSVLDLGCGTGIFSVALATPSTGCVLCRLHRRPRPRPTMRC